MGKMKLGGRLRSGRLVPALLQFLQSFDAFFGLRVAQEPGGGGSGVGLRERVEFIEERDLWGHADPGFGEQGGGIGVCLIFIAPRQARGQKGGEHIGDPDAEEGDEAAQDHRQGGAQGVLAREINHSPTRVTERDMPQFVRYDAGQLLGCDFPLLVLPIETAR